MTLLVSIVLIATACSSAGGDPVSAAATEAGETADDAAPTTTTTTTTTLPTGPATTFVPPLGGPFDLTGGIEFDAATADVIVDDDPDLPETLAQLPWPTDWTRRTVEDWNEFFRGLRQADPRDAIRPLDRPVFESPTLAAQWLSPREPGALVQFGGEARFYPLSIIAKHEVVNDVIGDVPVVVTFCPLCNTAISFDRRVNGEVLRFGVSGLLRKSDLVMWDSSTTSLWQQITGEAVVGDFAGAELDSIPTSLVSFSQFAENFPDGRSLAGESGFGRGAYGRNSYVGYSSSSRPFYNGEIDERLPALSRVVGITDDDTVASYAFDRLTDEVVVNDVIDGRPVVVFLAGDTADALDAEFVSTGEAVGSGVAHDPVVDGRTLTFTATGDDSFVDDQTGSTWSIVGLATEGEFAGTQLEPIEHRNEFWFAWQAFFGPDSLRE